MRLLLAPVGGVPFEEINDDAGTAPSKRLAAAFPGYSKTADGVNTVVQTGLAQVRARCPRFSAWVAMLERWVGAAA